MAISLRPTTALPTTSYDDRSPILGGMPCGGSGTPTPPLDGIDWKLLQQVDSRMELITERLGKLSRQYKLQCQDPQQITSIAGLLTGIVFLLTGVLFMRDLVKVSDLTPDSPTLQIIHDTYMSNMGINGVVAALTGVATVMLGRYSYQSSRSPECRELETEIANIRQLVYNLAAPERTTPTPAPTSEYASHPLPTAGYRRSPGMFGFTDSEMGAGLALGGAALLGAAMGGGMAPKPCPFN